MRSSSGESPDVAELTKRVQALDALTRSGKVEEAREALRRYLQGGTITCTPEGGAYVARAELLPLAVLLNDEAPRVSGGPLSSLSCAGAIHPLYHSLRELLRVKLAL